MPDLPSRVSQLRNLADALEAQSEATADPFTPHPDTVDVVNNRHTKRGQLNSAVPDALQLQRHIRRYHGIPRSLLKRPVARRRSPAPSVDRCAEAGRPPSPSARQTRGASPLRRREGVRSGCVRGARGLRPGGLRSAEAPATPSLRLEDSVWRRCSAPDCSAAQAATSFWMRGWFSRAHRTVFAGRPSRVSSSSVMPPYPPRPMIRVRVFRCSAMCGYADMWAST